MPRVKRSVASRKRRKKVLNAAKGFVGTRHSRYKVANEAVEHALVHAYRDRKRRKRDDAAALDHPHQRGGARRGALVQPVRRRAAARPDIELDRKVLADIAVDDPQAFGKIAEQAKAALARRQGRRPRGRARARLTVFDSAGGTPVRVALAALRRSLPALRRRPRGRRARRPRADVGRAAAAPRRAALPRARRRGELGRPARGSSRVSARLHQRAGCSDERGAALLGVAAAAPAGRSANRRAERRPRRARAERGPEPRLGSLPVPVRGRRMGLADAPAPVPGRGAPPGSGGAARALAAGSRPGGNRPRADRRHERGGRTSPALLRLGRPGRAARAARSRDRGAARRSAGARARRFRRAAAGDARRPAARRADGRLPDGDLGVPRTSERRARLRAALEEAGRSRRWPSSRRASRGTRNIAGGCGSSTGPARDREFAGHADFHGAWLDWEL